MSKQVSNISFTNSKRIAKNTSLLYIRMLFIMGVSLFTSRVILQVLGEEDFGIYSVVGGIITMFTFINTAMVSTTQRYLNFELAQGDEDSLRKVFNTSLQIHIFIAFIIVILGETIGLWFLIKKLVIATDRMVAALWVYQCSIFSCVVSVMSAPYNADIIAHEKMSAFAYISVFEVILKLIIVYFLFVFPYDKLIVYAILLLVVQIIIRFIYSYYCHKHFKETHFKAEFNRSLIREMTNFAGWSFVGNLAYIFFTQGLNMMLNIFFGPVVNAARGIAVQVQSAVQQFVGGFQTAINPQITKEYASGNLAQMHGLMFRSARFSFFLLFFISLPVLLETKFLLTIWLDVVPDNTIVFTQIMICISLICTTANPLVIANQATGKVKKYQITVGGILLLILPISYIVLKLGAPAYFVFLVHLFIEITAQIARMYMLRNLIHIRMSDYIKNIYFPISITVLIAIIPPCLILFYLNEGWVRFIMVFFISLFSVGLSTFFVGLTKKERNFFKEKGLKILRK